MVKIKLGDVCNITKGKTGIMKAIPGEYPLVTTGPYHITHNEYQFDCKAVCVPTISATGHGHASIKRIHYIEGKFALGNILAAIIPKNESIVDPQFLYIQLSSLKDQILVPLMKGTANVSLTVNSLLNVEIDLPSIEKQTEISSIYNKILPISSKINKKLICRSNLLDKLRQAILQLAVQGKLVAQDEGDEPAAVLLEKIRVEKERMVIEKKIKKTTQNIKLEDLPFELPSNWILTNLQNITSLVTDGEHNTPPRTSTGIPLATAKNIRDGYLDFTITDFISGEIAEKCWNRCEPNHNDILIVCVGATTGRLCLLKNPPKFAIVRSVALIRPFENLIFPEYVAIVIKSPIGQSQIWDKVKQSAQPCLYINRINSIHIPIPPLEEQKRIVAKVDQLIALCDELEAGLVQAQTEGGKLMEAVVHHVLAE